MQMFRSIQTRIPTIIVLVLALAAYTFAVSGELDPSFFAGAAGTGSAIYDFAETPDGRMVAVGNFTSVDGRSENCLAYIDAVTGRISGTFGIGSKNKGSSPVQCNGSPTTVAVQPLPGGHFRIIVAGTFSNVGDDGNSSHLRSWIAGLTEDGIIDPTFIGWNPLGPAGQIDDIVVLPDGSVLLAGFSLTQVFTGPFTSVSVGRLVKLSPDGTFDAAFNANLGTGFSSATKSIGVLSTGEIIVAGAFQTVSGIQSSGIAKLSPTGVIDTTFSMNTGTGAGFAGVADIAIQNDDKIVAVGNFGNFNGAAGKNLVRLFANGATDGSLSSDPISSNTGPNNIVVDTVNQKLIAIGDGVRFTAGAIVWNDIARLNLADGSIDAAFSPGNAFDAGVLSAAVKGSDVIVSGGFTAYNGTLSLGFAQIDDHGVQNTAFRPAIGNNGGAKAVKVLSDDKVLVGGSFMAANGQIGARLLRLNAGDGSVDTSFAADLDRNSVFGEVTVIAEDPDNGNILIAGDFNSYGGQPHVGIALLNSFGQVYNTFNASVFGINAAVFQPDHKIVIAGSFTNVNGVGGFGRIARLNADGTTDGTFAASGTTCFNCIVNALALDGTGIIAGGTFTEFNGQSGVNRIAKLSLNNGALDAAYTTNSGVGFNGAVKDIDVRFGKITAVGQFTSYNNVTGNRIARVNANGSPDPSLDAGTGFDNQVEKLTIRADGTMIIIGLFSNYNSNQTWRGVAKIKPNGTFDDTFMPVDSMRPGTHNGTLYDVGAQATGGDIVVGLFNEWGFTPSVQFGLPRFGIVRLTDTSANVWKPEGTFQASSNDGLPLDHFGCSVAIWENTAVVGTCPTDTRTPDALVYVRQGSAWTLQQELNLGGPSYFNKKNKVDIVGDTIVIGQPNRTVPGLAAFVFRRNAGQWMLTDTLSAVNLGPQSNDDGHFGAAVAINALNGQAVQIAIAQTGLPGIDRGRIWTYNLDQGSVWRSSWIVEGFGASPDVQDFGASLHYVVGTLLIGAPLTRIGSDAQGAAYLYGFDQNGPALLASFTAADGETFDGFGRSVAYDSENNRVIVGADGVSDGRGAVYTFIRNPSNSPWAFEHKLLNPYDQPSARFGISLGLRGGSFGTSRIVVGAPGGSANLVVKQGVAFGYSLLIGSTPQPNAISAPLVSLDGEFGYSVDISAGGDLIVGAKSDSAPGVRYQGSAHLFEPSGGGTYAHHSALTLRDNADGDEFGASVAIDDDWAVMGAPGDDLRGTTDQGSVYVYHGVPADFYYGASWTFKQKLVAENVAAGERFGTSVAFGVNLMIVGAPGGQGRAYVYRNSHFGNTPWVFVGAIDQPDGSGDSFGVRVAAAGDFVFVSAYPQNLGRGAVYVFRVNPNNSISYLSKLTDPSAGPVDQFGFGLAASGNILLVGEPGIDGHKGSVIPFKRNGYGPYLPLPKVNAPDGVAGDRFGEAISISGDQALISSPTADVDGMANRGAIYTFQVNGAGTPIFHSKLTAFDGDAGDNFGISVSISGDAAIIGASFADPSSHVDQGAAYTFERARGVWAEKNKLVDPQGSAGDEMGKAVAVSGPSVLVGARSTNILPGRPTAKRPTGNQPNGGVFAYGFAPVNAPTAAHVSIGGRVMTSAGIGVNRSIVTLTDQAGNVRRVLSSSFGYYRFDDVEAGQTYVVSVGSKRYVFENPSRVISVGDDSIDLDFIALP